MSRASLPIDGSTPRFTHPANSAKSVRSPSGAMASAWATSVRMLQGRSKPTKLASRPAVQNPRTLFQSEK